MNPIKDLGTIRPLGVIPDNRTTSNSNVGLTEPPPVNSKPINSVQTNTKSNKLATFAVQRIQDYPNLVRDIRLDPQWHKVKYWGKR